MLSAVKCVLCLTTKQLLAAPVQLTSEAEESKRIDLDVSIVEGEDSHRTLFCSSDNPHTNFKIKFLRCVVYTMAQIKSETKSELARLESPSMLALSYSCLLSLCALGHDGAARGLASRHD